MEDYQFKVLVLINALAINNLAYSGKLYNMCDWLGIARASKNTEQIKKALEELQKQDFISYSVVNRNYNIFLSARGRKDKRFITLKRQWVKIIKEYNIAKNGKVNKN